MVDGGWQSVRNRMGTEETGICHVCGRTFPTQEELIKHLLAEHDKDLLGD
jgi:C2H2-type zinc finger